MIPILTHLLLQYKYLLIIPLAVVEGPIVMMLSGVLLKLGYFSFWLLYLSLMCGDLLGDIVWYALGYHAGYPFVRKYGTYFSITEENITTVENTFKRHHNAILILSKVTMGLGFAIVTLFTAGLVRIPFRRYLMLNFVGQFVWTGALIAVGYFLGNFYTKINGGLGTISVLAAIIIIFVALVGVAKYAKQRILAKNS